ncbi:MAG TPA: hypothetical protein VM223_26000, partial [Planctomycetota bacterium]|nr:hypothetical protein [Planctomycetota bacterium]
MTRFGRPLAFLSLHLIIPSSLYLFLVLSAASAFGETRVLVVGNSLAPAAKAWQEAGVDVQAVSMRDVPSSADALAAQCNVIVLVPSRVPAGVQQAIEGFVRGGGGLLIDASCRRSDWCGTPLDVLSPTVVMDGRSTRLGRIGEFAPGCPLADIPLDDFPRLASMQNVSIPDRNQVAMMSELSAWTFSKPPWHGGWEEWAFSADPQRMAVVSAARYGAGRTAAWGAGSIADAALIAWPQYGEATKRILDWLAGAGDARPVPMTPVSLLGYEPPKWWADPLAAGLRGMDQKVGLDQFMLPPEAFAEAGYAATMGGDAPIRVLFGKEANADPGDAKIVLRLPPRDDTVIENKPFDPAALKVVARAKEAALVNHDGSTTRVTLPYRLPPLNAVLPVVPGQENAPLPVELPKTWRIAFTDDSDTDADLADGWQAKDYADAAWQEGMVGEQKATLFGVQTGHDGAIWYRGTIDVGGEAISPNAALVIDAKCDRGWLTVYADGKEQALEPRRIVLPLSAIGAGRHLLAVRSYGELRSNYGVTSIRAERLPLLWRPDPDHAGWAEGWWKTDADESKFQPVNWEFGKDPAGQAALEGWMRLSLDKPENAAPFTVVLNPWLKVETKVFVNGKVIGYRGLERGSRYEIASDAFIPGRNSIAIWARFHSHEAHGLHVQVLPAERAVIRGWLNWEDEAFGDDVVDDDREGWRWGSRVRAVINFHGVPFYQRAPDAWIRMDTEWTGRTGWIGGSTGNNGQHVILFAPQA